MRRWNGRRAPGFTVAEVVIATAIVGVVAIVMYTLLNSGTNLFARNVAVNMAHQQARNGLMRVARDIRQAVSIPKLVDENLQAVSGAGPAAGITFQIVTNGPFEVINDPTSPTLIQIGTNDPKPEQPAVGDHMVVIDYDVEADITKSRRRATAAIIGTFFCKMETSSGSRPRADHTWSATSPAESVTW